MDFVFVIFASSWPLLACTNGSTNSLCALATWMLTGKCVMLAGWLLHALCWELYWLNREKCADDLTQSEKKSNISQSLSTGLRKQPLLSVKSNIIVCSSGVSKTTDRERLRVCVCVFMCVCEREWCRLAAWAQLAGQGSDKNRWVPKVFKSFRPIHHSITTSPTSLQLVMVMLLQGYCI